MINIIAQFGTYFIIGFVVGYISKLLREKRHAIQYQIIVSPNGRYSSQRKYGWFGQWDDLGTSISEILARHTISQDMNFYQHSGQPINPKIKVVRKCPILLTPNSLS